MTAAEQAAKWERHRLDDLAKLRLELDAMRAHAADLRAAEARRAKWMEAKS